MNVDYTIEDIKLSSDKASFEKALGLYKNKKIINIEASSKLIEADIVGTHDYSVYVDKKDFMRSDCNCYLGNQNIFCKHIIALAIYAVKNGSDIQESEIAFIDSPISSGILGELGKEDLKEIKGEISKALRFIKSYTGPSNRWFQYQDSLSKGSMLLSQFFAQLPISPQTTKLVISILLKLDKKLSQGGVDDSDGTVGTFIEQSVEMLCEYAKQDINCISEFKALIKIDTCFGWEKLLIDLYNKD